MTISASPHMHITHLITADALSTALEARLDRLVRTDLGKAPNAKETAYVEGQIVALRWVLATFVPSSADRH